MPRTMLSSLSGRRVAVAATRRHFCLCRQLLLHPRRHPLLLALARRTPPLTRAPPPQRIPRTDRRRRPPPWGPRSSCCTLPAFLGLFGCSVLEKELGKMAPAVWSKQFTHHALMFEVRACTPHP